MVVSQVKIKGLQLDNNFNSIISATMTDNSSNQLTSIEKNQKYPLISSNNQREMKIRHSQTSINNLLHPVTQQLLEVQVKCREERHLHNVHRTRRLKMCIAILSRRMHPNILTLRRRKPKSLSFLKSLKGSRDSKGNLNSSRDSRIVIRTTIWCLRLLRELNQYYLILKL